MNIWFLGLLAIGACGYIGFDPQGSDDAAVIDAASVDAPPNDAQSSDASQTLASGPFGTAERVDELSGDFLDDDPSLTGDMLEIYFKSDRAAGVFNIYRAVRSSTDQPFGAPVIDAELSSGFQDDSPEVSFDGLTIYISSRRDGNFDIYSSTRTERSQPWSVPARIEELRSTQSEYAAARDGSERYLVLTKADGLSQSLHCSQRASINEAWVPPTAIAPTSSSPQDYQSDGALDERGLLLFYAGSATGGAANRDLFVAERTDASAQFGMAQPIDELNTLNIEEDPWISPDLTTIYFTRETTVGNKDIYRATRPLSP